MGLLDDKVVLVNGGSQGVGAAIARAAVREGARVAVTGRRPEPGEALVAELAAAGGKAMFVRADLADAEQAKESVAEVAGAYGRVDCLVNSAGLTSRGTLLDTTPELFDQHIAINLRAPFFAMQAAVADMVGRHRRQHHHLLRARRAVVPRPVRRREGRADRPDPQRGARAPLRPGADQRSEHRLDRDRG